MAAFQGSEMEFPRQTVRLTQPVKGSLSTAPIDSVMRRQCDSLLCCLPKGLPADLVPCIVARDNNVGEYAVPSLRCATTAALA